MSTVSKELVISEMNRLMDAMITQLQQTENISKVSSSNPLKSALKIEGDLTELFRVPAEELPVASRNCVHALTIRDVIFSASGDALEIVGIVNSALAEAGGGDKWPLILPRDSKLPDALAKIYYAYGWTEESGYLMQVVGVLTHAPKNNLYRLHLAMFNRVPD